VRAAALRVVPFWKDHVGGWPVLAKVTERASDDHPRVRLEAVRALAAFNDVRAFEGAMSALDRAIDRSVDYALWLTARELKDAWRPVFQAGLLATIKEEKKLMFALEAIGSTEVVTPLIDAMLSGTISKDKQGATLKLIARLANSSELARILDWLRTQ